MTNIVLGGTRNGSNLVLSPTQLASSITINLVIASSTIPSNTLSISMFSGISINLANTPLRAARGVIIALATALTGNVRVPFTAGATILITNPTSNSLTVNIKGDKATIIFPNGYGDSLYVGAGKNITVDAGSSKVVRVDNISAFLLGKIYMTGGNGLVVYLLN